MSLWHCPTHGFTGPMACCASASRATDTGTTAQQTNPTETLGEHDARCATRRAVCNCADIRHRDKRVTLDDSALGSTVACWPCQLKAAGPLHVKWTYKDCAECYRLVLAALDRMGK